MLSEDIVFEELKKVIDPELLVNIVDLGLIYAVEIKDAEDEPKKDIFIDMTLTSPACPAGPQLISNSKNIVSQLEEVCNVEVKIVMDPPWTPDRMTEDAESKGANAIIQMRFATSMVMQSASEILAYGTAVVVE